MFYSQLIQAMRAHGDSIMQKKRPSRASGHISAQAFAEMDVELIEILDENSHPFMIMPREAALAQRLPHKVALIMVRNREGQVYIHRRSEKKKAYGGLWSVSASGFVKAGEAVEDAAARELSEELGITGLPINLAATAEPTQETDWAHVNIFISNPSSVIINPDPEEISAGMFVDEDELAALVRDMPEALTPGLKLTFGVVNLFNL
jgi:isopentenyl-diphosphate delta-isomerase